jgi:hypothetical protein
MADNLAYTPGSGATVATDDIGGAHYQRIKLAAGADGTAVDVSAAAPLPIAAYGELIEAIEAMRMAVQSLNRTIGLVQPDTSARMRVVVDAITGSLTLGTVSTVSNISTLATLTNQTQIGGFAANDQIPALMHMQADNLRRNISVT